MDKKKLIEAMKAKVNSYGKDQTNFLIIATASAAINDLSEETLYNLLSDVIIDTTLDSMLKSIGYTDQDIQAINAMKKPPSSPLKEFYATLSMSQGGPGYVVIYAKNEHAARCKMFEHYNNKWSFMYDNFEEIHPNDRIHLNTLN